ncbi:MAG: preprotein translocase subunit SecA [Bulleidia sp.]|nr:preprotein translocase subunit SecA [Bulleidia sp.]
MANFLSKLFDEDARKMRQIEKKIQPVLDLEEKFKAMSEEELKAMTPKLRERLANGETEDDILPEAFATAREACRRVIGEFPYKVQLMGAAVMQGGDIAEMKTGEGKTLTSVMAVYLNALKGEGVHVITVNEYLSQRDAEWMGQIHRYLGLTVGLNLRQLTKAQKRQAYACDITYTTNSELGFDYLRDNMVTRVEDRVLRGLNCALIDEVDSILIDESRTPLIISGGQKQTANLYLQADRFVKRLQENTDYEVDLKTRSVQLTEAGIAKAEKAFKVENLYNLQHTQLLHHLNSALKANYVMAKDVDYVVDEQEDEIVIVDPNTGRLMKGRQWSDGLHQAVEAKEGISIKQETTTLATITYQNFFRLYNKLSGMTGTAKTEEEEFLEIYNMYVFEIPTHRPVQRIDYPDAVYGTKKAKFKALVDEVVERHATGQPILVGTIAVETSEMISLYLKERKIPHEVLNAKNNAREADIIARAGRKGAVTIATNMAGRGTDIKLGDGVKELGGLCVLGSERHESRRIDNQLRGRSGRQGDPGMSRFYVSVQDDLMVRFGSERMEGLFASLGDQAVESKTVTKAISSAQRRVEGVNFDARKQLLQYDDVMRQQREVMYQQRDFILENEDVHTVIQDMFKRVISTIVGSHTDTDNHNTVNVEEVINSLNNIGFKDKVHKEDIENLENTEMVNKILDIAWSDYEEKITPIKDRIMPIEKEVSLRTIDRAWSNHIDTMEKLRNGIGLRGYAQSNPLQAYVQEGYQLFEDMMQTIAQEIVAFCMNVRVVNNNEENN